MIHLSTEKISRCYFLNREKLARVVKEILNNLRINNARLSVYFATDPEIRLLNKFYRKEDRVTDVLAFSMKEGKEIRGDRRYLGDIIISVDRAQDQAKIFNSTYKREIYLYIIHGILHLSGYDDEIERSRKKMRKKEEEIFNKIWKERG